MMPFSIPPQAHEVESLDDFDARPVHLDDERRDRPAVGVPGHDDDDVGHRPVRAPELLAVQDVGALLGPLDDRGEAGRIRSDIVFREGEGRDRALGEPRQIPTLLFLAPEELERLRDAD